MTIVVDTSGSANKTFVRRTKKRKKKRRNTAVVNRIPRNGPMPKAYTTKLRYAEYGISVNPAAGLAAEYIFRANCVYDPNESFLGHQPRGFDQLMPLYNHFTVIGSRIRVSAVNDDENKAVVLCLTLQAENTTQTNPLDLLERQDVKWTTLAAKGGGPHVKNLTMNFSAKKFFSKTDLLDDTSLRGNVSSSPTEQAYYHIGMFTHDGSTDPAAIDLIVQVDYIVTFHEPNDVASS